MVLRITDCLQRYLQRHRRRRLDRRQRLHGRCAGAVRRGEGL